MPDLEPRLPEMLRRAAATPSSDPSYERHVLRRARRRRVLNATAAGLAAVALVAGTVIGTRDLLRSNRTTIGDGDQSPSPSAGTVTIVMALPGAVWPEVDQRSLELSQARADAGDLDWRLDPRQTATAFATEVFGWELADVQTQPLEVVPGDGDIVVVPISNAGLGPGSDASGPPAPTTSVALRQLGTKGSGGIWTVVGADSDQIGVDPLPESARPGSTIDVHAPVTDVRPEWSGALALLSADPADGTVRSFPGELTETLSGSVSVPDDAYANVAVVVQLFDPEGTTVAVDVVPIAVSPGTSGASGATGPAATGPTATGPTAPTDTVPSTVLETRDLIAVAAETRDFDALGALIDPDRFSYNFSDGHDPVPEWRDDPAVLDMLATILQMPFATAEGTPDVGTVYIFPALVDADLTDLTAEEQAMLDALGLTDEDVQAMLDGFGSYVGPRTGIAEDGTWLYYTTGGD